MTILAQRLFLVCIALLPLVRPFSLNAGGFRVPVADVVFVVAFAFFAIDMARKRALPRISKFHWFIGLYGLTLVISAVFSEQPQRSFLKVLGEVYLFGLAALTFHYFEDERFRRNFAFAWLAGTAITIIGTLLGLALFYAGMKTGDENYFISHFGSLPRGNYPRLHSFFANANMMCNYLNVSLLLLFFAEFRGWLRRWQSVLFQAGIWLAAVFTFSAGLGGMVLSSGIWFFANRRNGYSPRSRRLVLAASLAAAITVFGSTLVSPDTENSASNFEVPLAGTVVEPSVRVIVWQNVFEKGLKHPFLGAGTGVDPAFVSYRTLGGDGQILRDAHNVWLSIFGQAGILGLAALIALTVYLTTCCRFFLNAVNEVSILQLSVSCAFAGAFIFQGLFGSFEDARHIWVLFGVLAFTAETGNEEERVLRSPHPSS